MFVHHELDIPTTIQVPPDVSPARFWSDFCTADPAAYECDFVPSRYEYRIWIVPNVLFLIFFALSMLGYLAVYFARGKTGTAFTVAMVLGVLTELLGYGGRVWSYENQWNRNPYLMQIICLTIAPAFLAAGVYLCLRRIVQAMGSENSRIRPEYYTRFFIPCDIVSLILQATGGGMTAVSSTAQRDTKVGDTVLMAGLISQTATLFLFILCSIDFSLRVWWRERRNGKSIRKVIGGDNDNKHERELHAMKSTVKFKGFVFALTTATLLIFWRSVYRCLELLGGWGGPLMARQDFFVAFEGVVILAACLVLNVFHPSVCMAPIMAEGVSLLDSRRMMVMGDGEGDASSLHELEKRSEGRRRGSRQSGNEEALIIEIQDGGAHVKHSRDAKIYDRS